RFEFETIFFTHQNLAVPLAAVSKIEVSRARGDWAGKVLGYPILGMLGAGLVGTLIMYAQCAPCNGEDDALSLAVAFGTNGAIGFLGGLVIGLISTERWAERWEEVPLERLRRGISPLDSNRFGVSFSVKF
ncbi:MAG: hypothetical protein OEZ54_09745, partial [Gemmatimonadota bacterium]|nr:hypothetical protein [Gemmatimonadota bacterium]